MAEQLRFEFGPELFVLPAASTGTKTCKGCGQEKPLSDFWEYKPSRTHGKCKVCMKAENQAYLQAHAEEIRQKRREYREANRAAIHERNRQLREQNPEKAREREREYRHSNKDHINALRRAKRVRKPAKPKQTAEKKKQRQQQYREVHKDHLREVNRQWRAANKEHLANSRRKYFLKNLAEIRSRDKERRKNEVERRKRYNQKYYLLHQERLQKANRIRSRDWERANREKCREALHRRKARLAGNGGQCSVRDLKRLWNRFGGLCAYCGIKKATTIEHVIPISRGGTSFVGNLLPACGGCNYSKNARTVMEWRMMKIRRSSLESVSNLRRATGESEDGVGAWWCPDTVKIMGAASE